MLVFLFSSSGRVLLLPGIIEQCLSTSFLFGGLEPTLNSIFIYCGPGSNQTHLAQVPSLEQVLEILHQTLAPIKEINYDEVVWEKQQCFALNRLVTE